MHTEKTIGITVLTNFSVRFQNRLPTVEWINDRFELLKKTALPSMNQQTHKDFVWLITSAPEWREAVTRIFQSEDIRSGIEVVVSEKPIPDTVYQRIHPGCNGFITANLDSDDTFHKDTLSRLAALGPRLPNRSLVNMPNGAMINWNTGELLYMKFQKDYQGPFLAVKHDNREEMFRMGGNHRLARQNFDHVNIIPELSWIRTVHGGNVVNHFPSSIRRIQSWLGLLPSGHYIAWRSVPRKDREVLLAQCGIKWPETR